MNNLSLKELRLKAKLTQREMHEELGIPIRSIQNWENEVRECPDYLEEMLKRKLTEMILVAKIKHEKSFGENKEEGFSCYIKDQDDPDSFNFAWFIPSKNGLISTEIVYSIGRLIENGWKVIFIN